MEAASVVHMDISMCTTDIHYDDEPKTLQWLQRKKVKVVERFILTFNIIEPLLARSCSMYKSAK